jgi:hypothetical protein
MTNAISWTARLAPEKARARRLIASRQAIISQTIHETYFGKRGIVNYEAWEIVEQTSAPRHDRKCK